MLKRHGEERADTLREKPSTLSWSQRDAMWRRFKWSQQLFNSKQLLLQRNVRNYVNRTSLAHNTRLLCTCPEQRTVRKEIERYE